MSKTLKFTFSLVCIVLFIGCSNNADTTTPAATLAGEWKLVNVTGGFAGVNDNFTPGLIKWNVNTVNQTITVVNNNTNPDSQDILESGVYNYSLVPDPNSICTNTININGMNLGCYAVSATELEITYEYADGFTLRLIR